MAAVLLANGAEVNARNSDGKTPLHAAAWRGCVEVVRVLLAHKADAAIQGNMGFTAVDEARSAGHEAVVELLAGTQP
ncbi:MAG TPA: ankyrin repeat domain-containing protein [Thermoguttaceae bacterium]|nr:ankyrin repeat domain-containing protein [Thermoguttaceae bacterium]